jgi:hypothetical protein
MSYPHDVNLRACYLRLLRDYHKRINNSQEEELAFLDMIEENNDKIKIYEKRDPHHYGELVSHLKLSNKTLVEMLDSRYAKNPELFNDML